MTSVSNSPLMSGTSASKRVKPISASTSRRRWSWITVAIESVRGGGANRAAAAGMEVRVDRDVVLVALGLSEQRVELDQLDRQLGDFAALELVDRAEHVFVAESGQSCADGGHIAHERRGLRSVDGWRIAHCP